MDASYHALIDRLLELARPEIDHTGGGWPDYRELGVGPEQVPLLVRILFDEDLLWADSDTPEVWVPVHAWRALGQLRAPEAAEPLAELLASGEDEDWIREEVPRALGIIGRPALAPAARVLDDSDADESVRIAAADAVRLIAEADPGVRDEAVAVLVRRLGKWYRQDDGLNASLIDYLVELGVREAAPVMEEAFAGGGVDLMVRGDWEDIQVDLGLLPARLTPRPDYFADIRRRLRGDSRAARSAARPGPKADQKTVAKAKRKAAKKARKRNRR